MGPRMIRTGLVSAALCLAASAPAGTDNASAPPSGTLRLNASYSTSVLIFRVGRIDVTAEVAGGRYSADAHIEAAGLAALFTDFEIDSEVEVGESFAEVESTKSVSDIFGPLNGTISKVNDELDSSPDLVNSEPYDSGWLVEISLDDASVLDAQLADMLDADGYRAVIEG